MFLFTRKRSFAFCHEYSIVLFKLQEKIDMFFADNLRIF